jgi:hypothetical protein
MFFKHLRHLALSSSFALLTFAAPLAAQVTVTGQVTTDNFFVVNLSYGPNQTTTIQPGSATNTASNQQWASPSTYNFTIDETRLGHCHIQIVTWNADAASPAAVSALFSGNASTELTGGTQFRAYDTTVPSSTFGAAPAIPPIQIMESWVRLTDNIPSDLTYFVNSVWGISPVMINNNTAAWVWSDGADQSVLPGSTQNTHYRSFTLPCASIVQNRPTIVNPPAQITSLDHFQCYGPENVEGELEKVEIFVEDQFGEGQIVLAEPVLHCNPSGKVHNDEKFEIVNKEDHLVCYEIVEQTDLEGRRVETESVRSSVYE